MSIYNCIMPPGTLYWADVFKRDYKAVLLSRWLHELISWELSHISLAFWGYPVVLSAFVLFNLLTCQVYFCIFCHDAFVMKLVCSMSSVTWINHGSWTTAFCRVKYLHVVLWTVDGVEVFTNWYGRTCFCFWCSTTLY